MILLTRWCRSLQSLGVRREESEVYGESELRNSGWRWGVSFDSQFFHHTSRSFLNKQLQQEVNSGDSVVRGPSEGKFTFTSHEASNHSICLSTNNTAGWFQSNSQIRLYLDTVVGSTKPNVEQDRTHAGEVAGKIRDLNASLRNKLALTKNANQRMTLFVSLTRTPQWK